MIQPQAIEFCDVIVIESVIDLPPVFASADQSQLAQSSQLVRHCGLSHLEFCGDVTHVHFPFKQNGNDPQSGSIAEGAEEVSQMGGGVFL
jgi:hypothetical protein